MLEGKWGNVSEHGPKGFVRVTFPDADDLPSPLLPVGYQWTGHVKVWNPPPVGLRVFCLLSDNGESGVVAFAAYTSDDAPPSDSPDVWAAEFADGARLEYDQGAHKLTANLGSGEAEVTATKLKVVGELEVTGKVTAGGDIRSSGNISTTLGDVQAGATSLKTHIHTAPGGFSPAPTTPPL